MGLTTLSAAISGLRIAQSQIGVISTNVANVGTPGYSRKILPQSSQTIQGMGVGVEAGILLRNVSLSLEKDMWTQVSATSYLDVQSTYMSRIEQFHGDPSKAISVAADVSRLQDRFVALSDTPEDNFLLSSTINQAVDTANKINDFSNLITGLRNDAQDEMQSTVTRINDLLTQIANLNTEVKDNLNANRSAAFMEDKRDDAIKELAALIDISSFTRGDGVLVIQTSEGTELASNHAAQLTFRPSPVSADNAYPGSAAGVYVGDPVTDPLIAVDITTRAPGGKLGGLIELRDAIFPKQMAQIDELAHKLALRMDAQGLRLFTDSSGSIPLDTAPDPTTLPDPTPVPYVGFSAEIQVNQDILNDHSLLQGGTYGASLNTGSNEVISRVIEYAFGNIDYQEAYNTDTTKQVDLLNRGGADLQNWLGLFSSNTMAGGRDLSSFTSPAAFMASTNGQYTATSDTFRMTFEETRTGAGPVNLDIDLGAIVDGGGNFVQDLITHITGTLIPALPAADQTDLTAMGVTFSEGTNGQLIVNTRGSYVVDITNPANPMSTTGLSYLGLVENTGDPVLPTDPYFDVQVGNNAPVRITIEPADTHADLIAKLQAVSGLAVDTTNFALDGLLRLRPGNSYTSPDFGGNLRITGGPFVTDNATYSDPPALTGTRTTIADGVNIVSALFGTYSVSGTSIQDSTPVQDVLYGSETDGSLAAPIPTISFRESLLGPGANLDSEIIGSSSLADFAQKMVNEQSQQVVVLSARAKDEKALQDILEKQLMDDSGVNLDEELGHLITVQTAYGAAARVLTSVNELFDQLMNAV